MLVRHSLLASFPVFTQVEFASRERCGDEFENGKRYPTGVYLLEYLADGFTRRIACQLNGRDLELLESEPDFLLELH